MDGTRSLGADGTKQFWRRWYGYDGEAAVVPLPAGVPSALAAWHSFAARVGGPVTFQDHPIALEDLSLDREGMLPFWVENQHGQHWAVDPDDPQTWVFGQAGGSDDWVATGEKLEDFLLHCTIREAIFGAPRKFTVFVAEPLLGDALASFSVLNFPALASEEPETTLWSTVDALARVAVPPVGYEAPNEKLWMVTMAATSAATVEKYGKRLGLGIPEEFVSATVDTPVETPPF